MSVAASDHKVHNLSWSEEKGVNRGGDGFHEEIHSGQDVDEAIRKGLERALGSIAEVSKEVDSASTGVSDGVASRQDIRSALEKGVFDGDTGKIAVEQLLQNTYWLNLYWGRNATDDHGRLAINLADLDAYRRSGGQSGDDSSRAFDQREGARRVVEEGVDGASGDWTALNLRGTADGSDPALATRSAPSWGYSAVSDPGVANAVSMPSRDARSATSAAPQTSVRTSGASWSVLPSQRRFETEPDPSSANGQAPNPADSASTGAVTATQTMLASATEGDVVAYPGSTASKAQGVGGASGAMVSGNGSAPSAAADDLSNSTASDAASVESPALASNGMAPGSTISGATTSDTTDSGTNDSGANTQTEGLDSITRLRGAIIDNFGFLDVASSSTTELQQSRDGKVNRADIAEAARTRMLESEEVQLLSQLAADGSVYDALDLEDGYKDGELVFSSLVKNDTRPSVEQKPDVGLGEVPDVRFAHYSDEFFQTQQQLVTQGDVGRAPDMAMVQDMSIGSPSVVDQVRDDKAGFNAFDSLDGTSDGIISGARLRLEGVDAKEVVFSQPANDGSGRSVLEAAMSALGDEYKAAPRPELPGDLQNDRAGSYRMALALWDNLPSIAKSDTEAGTYQPITQEQITAAVSNPVISAADRVSLQQLASNQEAMNWLSGSGGQSAGGITQQSLASVVTDFNRANFSGILMAQGAVQNGIPLKTAKFSGAQFPEDMAKEFCAEQVFNPGVTEAAYKRLMADPAIQQALSAKVRQFISNADSAARKLFDEITSPYYIDSLDYLERQSGGQGLSEQKMTTDLAALGTLDSGLAEKASLALLQQKFVREIAEATPSRVPEEELVLATRDALAILSVELRTVRGVARLPGLLLGHDSGWQKLGSLFSGWSPKQWRAVADLMPKVLIKADNASSIGSAGMSRSPSAQSVINTIDATVSEAGAQLEGSASVAERTRNQGSFNFLKENASRLKEFVSAAEKHGVWASLAGAISMASGVYKLAKGGNSLGSTSWGRLSIANDFVLAACFTPGYVNLGNFVAGKLGSGFNPASIGLAPNQRFADLVRASFTGDASIVGTRLGGAVTGMLIKGLTGGSLLAAGAIGGAMGIKQIVDGVRLGEGSDIAAGSLNIAMGTAWAASGVTYLMASALTGPLIGVGCLFGIASALVSLFGPKPESQFAKLFEEKVGDFADSGVLREGWRDQVKNWFVTSRSSIPDEEYDGYTGMGMDA